MDDSIKLGAKLQENVKENVDLAEKLTEEISGLKKSLNSKIAQNQKLMQDYHESEDRCRSEKEKNK